jgi:hypothetical protein
MTDATTPRGWESRLLAELVQLVERDEAPERRGLPRRPRLAVVAAVVAAAGVLAATTTAAWQALTDDRKVDAAARVDAGGHVGPLVAQDGTWRLFAETRPGRAEWELAAPSFSALGTFVGSEPLEVTTATAGPAAAIAGRVTAAGVSQVRVELADGRSLAVPLRAGRFFVRALAPGERAQSVVAVDAAGRELARAAAAG